MFINKATNGCNNVCGKQIAKYRRGMGKSQRELADVLQLAGLDVDKNAIQRIEAGKRFVTDIELVYLAKVLNVTYDALLTDTDENMQETR
ncbi:MAG: helix-turn-helix transcriptional regulator [Oscillospiraceae bacterium]|nr:helix-turn-helix transcriptional regulator [Oscillospiraceae bacterium]